MEVWFTLTGNIDPNVVGQAISWINGQIYNTINLDKLKFLISSTGGDIDSAIRLHDYLKALPLDVETIGFGQVDSAAITIFLAGERRVAVKGCRFTIHEGIYNIGQPSAPLHVHEETLRLFHTLLERNIEIVAHATGKTKAKIKAVAKEGQGLTSEKAKELGIVTEIVEKLPLAPQVLPPFQPAQQGH